MRKWFVMLMALLLVCLLGTADGESVHTFGIQNEEMKMEASGLSAHEWEEAVADACWEGLENQLDAEAIRLADPDAVFYEENGTIYSIQGKHLAGSVEDELDACYCA